MLGKLPGCSFYLINLFAEFQTPYLHFSSPYKKGQLEMKCKTVCSRVHTPPSSQIAGHLNKVPMEIQSLSLLIVSGSDRQHEC